MGRSQSGAICESPASYLPLPACYVPGLRFCPHDGVLLSGNSCFGARREVKGSRSLGNFII